MEFGVAKKLSRQPGVYGKVGGRLPNAFREVAQLFEGKLSKALSAWISLDFSVAPTFE
jgi:hypothetical protein